MSACKRLDLETEFAQKTSRHCCKPGPLELVLFPFEKMAMLSFYLGREYQLNPHFNTNE